MGWFGKQDPLSEELKKLERQRAEAERVARELESKLQQSAAPLPIKPRQPVAYFMDDEEDELHHPKNIPLKIDHRHARTRGIALIAIALILLALLIKMIF